MVRPMASDITNTNTAIVAGGRAHSTLLEARANPDLFPRVNSLTREQAVFEVSKIVSMAFLYRGQAADETTIRFISSSLVEELMSENQYHAGNISFAEIREVVKRAVLGGSEMFGISVSSLYKVILDYVKGEGHLIQKMVDDRRKAEQAKETLSPVQVKINAVAGEFLRNHKIK